LELKAEDLVGTWRLRSWKNVGSDGSEVYPLGERPVGYIFYNHDGYMSVEIMAQGRVPYQVPDVFGGTPRERSEAISTYISYAGPFELLADRDTVIHHIEVCSYPNWIGNAQVRFAKREGDLLVLSTTKPVTFQGVTRSAELVWERVGQH
jgi:hypothetical protein